MPARFVRQKRFVLRTRAAGRPTLLRKQGVGRMISFRIVLEVTAVSSIFAGYSRVFYSVLLGSTTKANYLRPSSGV